MPVLCRSVSQALEAESNGASASGGDANCGEEFETFLDHCCKGTAVLTSFRKSAESI